MGRNKHFSHLDLKKRVRRRKEKKKKKKKIPCDSVAQQAIYFAFLARAVRATPKWRRHQ